MLAYVRFIVDKKNVRNSFHESVWRMSFYFYERPRVYIVIHGVPNFALYLKKK